MNSKEELAKISKVKDDEIKINYDEAWKQGTMRERRGKWIAS